jgi:serine/threonine protein kinase
MLKRLNKILFSKSTTESTIKSTLTTPLGTFTLTRKCEDTDLVRLLVNRGALGETATVENFKLDCIAPFGHNTVNELNLLGIGNFSATYLLNLPELGKDQSIKFTHTNMDRALTNELQGLFIQSYIRRIYKCDNICDIYEFGTYELNPNRDFVNTLPNQAYFNKSNWYKSSNTNDALLFKSATEVKSGVYNEGVYATMEPFQQTFSEYLKTPHDVSEIKQIFFGIFQAISCMQKHNIVHLDIKPDNIGIQNSNAKVFDFGFAQDYKAKTGVKGTPGYVDPFFITYLTPRLTSDIYAVGVMLYEHFTKKEVIKDLNSLDSFQKLDKNKINEIEDKNLKYLITGCLNPTDNFLYGDLFTADQALENPWFRKVGGRRLLKKTNKNLLQKRRNQAPQSRVRQNLVAQQLQTRTLKRRNGHVGGQWRV